MKKKTTKQMLKKGGILILVLIVLSMILYLYIYTREERQAGITYDRSIYIDPIDSTLFVTSELNNLTKGTTVSFPTRESQKTLFYDSLGAVIYTTIELNNEKEWDEIFFMKNEKYPRVKAVDFISSISVYPYGYGKVDSIIFSYTGQIEELREVRFSDNFRSYYLPVQTFSVRYGESKPSDISFRASSIRGFYRVPEPIMIAFLKRKTTVFFIIFKPFSIESGRNKQYKEIFPDFLGQIINWQEELKPVSEE